MGRVLIAGVWAALAMAAPARGEVRETDSRRVTYSGLRELWVDIVTGAVEVEGYNGGELQVEIVRTIRADDRAGIEKAKREVKLEPESKDGRAEFYEDGPFRCGCRDCGCSNNVRFRWQEERYVVRYDLKIRAPRAMALKVRTVNESGVKVRGMEGDFEIHDVNSGVEMAEAGGSGTVTTVNGPVKVEFARNPAKPCSFKTVNGKVEVAYVPGLNADLKMKTFHGGLFTDFEVTAAPPDGLEVEERGGKKVYRSNRFTKVRAGSGGPEMKFETLNGDVVIRKR